MDIIQRNIERLITSGQSGKPEPIEPMSEWKWRKLYKTAQQFGIGPWIADGIRICEGDFFMQMSPTLRQQMLAMNGEKDEERLSRFYLQMDRESSILNRFKRESLRVYAKDFINTIKNIEE